jgi:cytochrome c-type biogenesis protein CcmH/NrfG
VVVLEPGNTRGRFLLAKILVREGECKAGAEHLETILAAEPENTEAVSLLSQAYYCSGRAEEGAEVRRQFAALAERTQKERETRVQSDHLVREAGEKARSGEPNEALQLLQRALTQDPDNDAAFSQLSKVLYAAGRWDVAGEAAARALALNPYRSDALYVLGLTRVKQNDLVGAREALVQTTLINPLDAEALFVLSQVHLDLDDRQSAVEALRAAVALEPDNTTYSESLERILAASDR